MATEAKRKFNLRHNLARAGIIMDTGLISGVVGAELSTGLRLHTLISLGQLRDFATYPYDQMLRGYAFQGFTGGILVGIFAGTIGVGLYEYGDYVKEFGSFIKEKLTRKPRRS